MWWKYILTLWVYFIITGSIYLPAVTITAPITELGRWLDRATMVML